MKKPIGLGLSVSLVFAASAVAGDATIVSLAPANLSTCAPTPGASRYVKLDCRDPDSSEELRSFRPYFYVKSGTPNQSGGCAMTLGTLPTGATGLEQMVFPKMTTLTSGKRVLQTGAAAVLSTDGVDVSFGERFTTANAKSVFFFKYTPANDAQETTAVHFVDYPANPTANWDERYICKLKTANECDIAKDGGKVVDAQIDVTQLEGVFKRVSGEKSILTIKGQISPHDAGNDIRSKALFTYKAIQANGKPVKDNLGNVVATHGLVSSDGGFQEFDAYKTCGKYTVQYNTDGSTLLTIEKTPDDPNSSFICSLPEEMYGQWRAPATAAKKAEMAKLRTLKDRIQAVLNLTACQ